MLDDLFNAALGMFCLAICWLGRRIVNHLDNQAKAIRHCERSIDRLNWKVNLEPLERDD